MRKIKVKTYSTNRILIPILFIICSIAFELLNFIYLGFNNSNGNNIIFPVYFLFDLSIILMIAGFIFLLQNQKAMWVFFYIFLSFQFIINIVNTTMYKVFGDIFSFDLLKLGEEAKTAMSLDFIDWGGILLNLSLLGLTILLSICLIKFNKRTYQVKNFSTPIIALAFFIFFQSFGLSLFEVQKFMLKDTQAGQTAIESSDIYLWNNFQFKLEAYKKFGYFGFYAKDAINYIFPSSLDNSQYNEYIEYIDSGYVEGNSLAPLYGDNLIVILCESMDSFAIDPIYTPTLWSIYNGNNSAVMTNFHAYNRTNICEGIALLGNMPKNSQLKDGYNNGYNFSYSLPNLFKSSLNDNAQTTFLHPNTKEFYYRNITHGSDGIGFDNAFWIGDYGGEQEFSWGQWVSDLEFTNYFIDYIMPQDSRFLTFFSSMSTHGPYTNERENLADLYVEFDNKIEEYKDWFTANTDFIFPEDETTYQMFRNYKVGTIDFDNTVNNLINQLEARGLSENTSIVFFADHNAYYHDFTYTMKGIDKTDFSNIEINHIPAFIYSPKLYGNNQGVKIDVSCSTYDILPTICQLYGLESNINLFQGNSIFSEEIKNSIFVSHLGGIFDDKIYSRNLNDLYYKTNDITETDIQRFKYAGNKFIEKQSIIELIYKNGINGRKSKY